MSETTEIEKKSLEAHVELCAERYRNLDERLEHMDEKIGAVEKIVREVHDMINLMSEKRNAQLINWGAGIIVGLLGAMGWLLTHYVLK
jgi:prefoldin subunit 5